MRKNIRLGIWLWCAGVASLVSAAGFPDIAAVSNRTAIEFLMEKGIVSGYPDGTFRPDVTLNRAELAKMLVKAMNISMDTQTGNCFPDVTTQWFAPFVCTAKKEGWIRGYDDGTFRPDATVTMVEGIKMIVMAMGYDLLQSSATPLFSDVDPAAWYAPFVTIANRTGLLDDLKGPALGVGTGMSRGIFSSMLYRSMLSRESAPIPLFRQRIGSVGGTLRTPVITFGDISAHYGDTPFAVSAISNSTGRITYTIDNPGIATVRGSTITIHAAGSTGITATQEADGNFAGATKTASLTVHGIAPTITFSNLTKSHIDANFTLSATSDSPGAITYTSGNVSLVTISGTTADIVGTNGTTTITASQAASGNYAAGNATMTLTVFATYCISEPCINGGTCVPTLGGNGAENFLCTCLNDHYAGVYCEESDLNCYENGGDLICNNGGACVKDIDGGICDCVGGFCGNYCQILPSHCGV